MTGESLGAQIARARGALGMTQEDLSAALKAQGVTRGGSVRAIQDWEANKSTPHPRTLATVRVILGLEGSEEETRSQWPARVQTVTDTFRSLLATLPPDDLRRWRHEFIVSVAAYPTNSARYVGPVPDDAEVITSLVGAFLVADWDYPE